MANRKRPSDRKKSSHDGKISLRTWKKTWSAETATFEEAKSLRRRVVKRLWKGNDQERKTAQTVEGCWRHGRCDFPDCPVCERNRRRTAQRSRGTQGMPPEVYHASPSVIMTRAADIAPEKVEWLWAERIASRKALRHCGQPRPRKITTCRIPGRHRIDRPGMALPRGTCTARYGDHADGRGRCP